MHKCKQGSSSIASSTWQHSKERDYATPAHPTPQPQWLKIGRKGVKHSANAAENWKGPISSNFINAANLRQMEDTELQNTSNTIQNDWLKLELCCKNQLKPANQKIQETKSLKNPKQS